MMRVLIGAALSLIAAGTIAAERLPSFPKGTTYGNARPSLQAIGWQPVENKDRADICSENDDRCRWPEAEYCSGTGVGACLYRWRRGDTVIAIGTRGDDPQVVYSIRCEVNCKR
ncbi:hypothetical protein GGC47_001053 [Bosea sp. OAE752]|uniref:hypothetical protein n=1 Tax=Bosea sp. OAE752 TaxID=2663873 RepID=UPI003D1FB9C9